MEPGWCSRWFRCTVKLVTSGRTEAQLAPLLQQEKMARFLALFLTAVYKQLYRDMGADMRSADTRVHALSVVCRHPMMCMYAYAHTYIHKRIHNEISRSEIAGP